MTSSLRILPPLVAAGLLFLASVIPEHCQAVPPDLALKITPDRADWTYETGSPVRMELKVVSGTPLNKPAIVRYRVGAERYEAEIPLRAEVPADGSTIEAGTLDRPGFLRMIAYSQIGAQRVQSLATAAISPEKIQPTQTEPDDFDAFWKASLDELAKIPMDAKAVLRPDRSGPGFDAYELSLANYDPEGGKNRFYGMLCVPKGPGPFPAVLQTPGAGVRSYTGELWLPRDQFITLEVGIHGIRVTESEDFYQQLMSNSLRSYERRNLDNREKFYFRRVYLGCHRAVEFLTTHPKWDGKNLVVRGGSQGGQLAIVCAALHSRVTAVAAAFPAFCDVTGSLHGRAVGWPNFFTGKPPEDPAGRERWAAEIQTTGYYDVVNFARRLKVPSYFAWGFNDEVCSPTTFHAMYNQVTAPKELKVYPSSGHNLPPEGWDDYGGWSYRRARGEAVSP